MIINEYKGLYLLESLIIPSASLKPRQNGVMLLSVVKRM
jgi:hypothetical protein